MCRSTRTNTFCDKQHAKSYLGINWHGRRHEWQRFMQEPYSHHKSIMPKHVLRNKNAASGEACAVLRTGAR